MSDQLFNSPSKKPLELWGGFECTVNRVHNTWMDQLELSGHDGREGDLELLKDLGVTSVRYPVLWERLARNGIENIDWSWSDRRLNRLRELGIRPIVGLLHHGSGPEGTDLLDPQMPEQLAAFARAVAERYPWVDCYTPVNEPLTTARFSCLYGYWYPHHRNDHDFLVALMNQVRAIVLAIREVRLINPSAQLIQTEDLGKTHSTSCLQYQADFENERRWLSLDLLCGKFTSASPLWDILTDWGVGPKQLEWFAENPCTPDVLGFNYYLSSERYLDDRTDLYPTQSVGGNGRHRYIDIEAARVLPDGIEGCGNLLAEAYERYGLPLAITELHNGCTREEQARWFVEQWNEASRAAELGVDIRAVTAWSLLGSSNWNTLVTRKGIYEPGIYDVRAPQPWPTVMVPILQQLARGEDPIHPVLQGDGWWRRPERFCVQDNSLPSFQRLRRPAACGHPILISGLSGTLGQAFERICKERGLAYRLLGRAEMDIANAQSVQRAIDHWRPWAIVNAAGYVRVDDAEVESQRCFRENTAGPAVLASICRGRDIRLMTFSSDLVFNGQAKRPYVESDPVHPLNSYGRSKALAESAVMELLPSALVIRTSAFFGPWDKYNFVARALNALASGKKFSASANHIISPTYVPDLVNTSLDLLIDGATGIWHLANDGSVSWAQLALMAANKAGVPTANFSGFANRDWTFPAPRPRYAVLGSERHRFMPSLEDALDRYVGLAPWQTLFTPEMPDELAA